MIKSIMYFVLQRLRFVVELLLLAGLSVSVVSADSSAAEVQHQGNSFFEAYYALEQIRVPVVGYRDETTVALPGYSDEYTGFDADPRDSRTADNLHMAFVYDNGTFFLEGRTDGGTIEAAGYHLRDTPSQLTSLIYKRSRKTYQPWIKEGYESINERGHDELFGIRSIRSFSHHQLSFELFKDVRREFGYEASISIGGYRQLGRFDVEGFAGLGYTSSGINNYYYGVSTEEASELAPAYTAGHALVPKAGVSVALPLSNRWVLKTSGALERFPGSMTNSPLVMGRVAYRLSTGLHFVFR